MQWLVGNSGRDHRFEEKNTVVAASYGPWVCVLLYVCTCCVCVRLGHLKGGGRADWRSFAPWCLWVVLEWRYLRAKLVQLLLLYSVLQSIYIGTCQAPCTPACRRYRRTRTVPLPHPSKARTSGTIISMFQAVSKVWCPRHGFGCRRNP